MDKITIDACKGAIELLEQEPKIGQCKECKYFEYNQILRVKALQIPVIVAHEVCTKWGAGDGCQTKEDGYCFLFEPQERSEKECR